MRRKPKPEPESADVERPCGSMWFHGDGDCACKDRAYLHSHGCACGRPDSDHERFREIWRAMAAEEVDTETIRKQLNRALADRVEVRQRMPMRTGVLHENGRRRRYLLDGTAIDLSESETD